VAVARVGVEGDGGSTMSGGRWLTVVGEETLCFLAWKKSGWERRRGGGGMVQARNKVEEGGSRWALGGHRGGGQRHGRGAHAFSREEDDRGKGAKG
jgi:hypothetical protein